MKITRISANLLLMIITVFWGLGFVLSRMALDNGMTASLINFLRGLLFLVMTLAFFHKKIFNMTAYDFKVGLLVGIFNFLGFITQTIGAKFTTPSNNAFLTVTNVLMVPFIVWAVYKKRPKIRIFVSVIICLYGMAILTGFIRESYSVNIGDLYTIVCAFFFALSIAVIGNSALKSEFSVIAFMMAAVQMAGSLVLFIFQDIKTLSTVNWASSVIQVIILGVVCSFFAQTVQVIAQKHTSASSAALIMTLEGVFGAVFSILFKYEVLSYSLIIGGLLIMLSLFISEYDFNSLKKPKD